MPPETIAIEQPPAPLPEQVTSEPQGEQKLNKLFESLHAQNTGNDVAVAPEPPKPVRERAPEPPAPTESAPEPVKPPSPSMADFVPPDTLLEATIGAPDKIEQAPSVADIMPEEPPTSIKTEKGKSDYKKWREHQLSLEHQLKERVTEAAPELVAKNKELEARLAELSAIADRVALTEKPSFQQEFIAPRKQMMDAAKKALEMAGGDFADFERMLTLSDRARIEAIDGLLGEVESPTLKNNLANIIGAIENLDYRRELAMSDARKNREARETHELAQQQQMMEEREKEGKAVLEAAFTHLRDKVGFEYLKEIPGNTKWNDQVKSIRDSAEHILFRASKPEAAAAAYLAPQAVYFRAAYYAEREKRLKAEAENAEFKGATPSVGVGAGQDTVVEPDNGTVGSIFRRVRASTG